MNTSRWSGVRSVLGGIVATLAILLAGDLLAEERQGVAHTIFMTAYEVKGSTTTDKLPAPTHDPTELSKGYGYKGPGSADTSTPQRWEVSSYMFNPASVTVRQGDDVVLHVFVVNGDEHESWVTGPDGTTVVPKAMWRRGREYGMRFRTEKVGTYQLLCSSHAPTMVASFVVLPR